MHGGTLSYICPNCGISVLFESKNCTRHVSPYVDLGDAHIPVTHVERHESVTPHSGKHRLSIDSLETVADAFVKVVGITRNDLLDTRGNNRLRYFRRMLSYILYTETVLNGKRMRFRDIAALFRHALPTVQNDVSKFGVICSLSPDETRRLATIIDRLVLELAP